MEWIELITLRSVDGNHKRLESELRRLIDEVNKGAPAQGITIYRRVRLYTDYSIKLSHSTEKVDSGGSPLGLRLVCALKDFALVNHSMWVEMNSK
jgi:hypothetical protein